MLSQYTWGQFGLFTLVLVGLYYLAVGFVYYRDEASSLLTPGKKGSNAQTTGATQLMPPALVRPTSAFRTQETKDAELPAATNGSAEIPEDGAAQNLPVPTELLIGGELPSSTAAATGLAESLESPGATEEHATDAATIEAQELDAERTEEEDHANEQLAALIRQKMHGASADSETAEVAYEIDDQVFTEPLADFTELMASTLDITPTGQEPLVEAESLADYLAQLQAGVKLPTPRALDGTSLEAQLVLLTAASAHELTLLFGEEA